VLSYIKNDIMANDPKVQMPVAILPLGTGNDLSRALGWGGSFTTKDVKNLILTVSERCENIVLDRWKVIIKDSKMKKGQEKSFYLYNYLGIGLDAKFALGFHNLRQKYPQLFKSQLGNKFIYGNMGAVDLLMGKKMNLAKNLTITCDGNVVTLPDLECIVIQNINYWGGGVCNVWGESDDSSKYLPSEYSDANATEEERPLSPFLKPFKKQTFYDGLIEVFGFTSLLHLGQAQGGFAQSLRVCQGSKIEIEVKKEGPTLPIHIDGEPFEVKPPFSISIGSCDKVDVLIKRSDPRLKAETKIIKVLNWAEETNNITSEQKDILIDKFFKELSAK